MLEPACAGAVYLVQHRRAKPAHYWVVLGDPRVVDGSFLVVSLTDRHNLPIGDVWPTGYTLCPGVRLAKPSVVALQYALVRTQEWLARHGAAYQGRCPPEVLARARCNLYWYPQHLAPDAQAFARFYASEWSAGCGTPPSAAC